MKKRKSWREKLRDTKDLPKIVDVPEKMLGRWGAKRGDILLIPSPLEVDELMRKVPEGKLVTIDQLRSALASKHGASICCPMTTGIFASIAAKAAEEALMEGERDITPYWRTLKAGGVINEKYPGGPEAQRRLLEREGHTVVQKGKKYVVPDYQRHLVQI